MNKMSEVWDGEEVVMGVKVKEVVVEQATGINQEGMAFIETHGVPQMTNFVLRNTRDIAKLQKPYSAVS